MPKNTPIDFDQDPDDILEPGELVGPARLSSTSVTVLNKPFDSTELPQAMSDADAATGKRLNASEWDLYFAQKAFKGEWLVLYREYLTDLAKHYNVLRSENPQYKILVRETAALATDAARAAAGHAPLDVTRTIRQQLLQHIQTLQRYTEAQKSEVTMRTELLRTALVAVVGIIETIVDDGETRVKLFDALSDKMLGKEMPPLHNTGQIITAPLATGRGQVKSLDDSPDQA